MSLWNATNFDEMLSEKTKTIRGGCFFFSVSNLYLIGCLSTKCISFMTKPTNELIKCGCWKVMDLWLLSYHYTLNIVNFLTPSMESHGGMWAYIDEKEKETNEKKRKARIFFTLHRFIIDNSIHEYHVTWKSNAQPHFKWLV